MVWKRVALDPVRAGEARQVRRRRHRLLWGDLVLGGGSLGLFELQLHLINEPGRAFGTWFLNLPLELSDPKSLMRDLRLILGRFGHRDRQLRCDRILFPRQGKRSAPGLRTSVSALRTACFSVSTSSGRASGAVFTTAMESQRAGFGTP